jgi:hypothetical protein
MARTFSRCWKEICRPGYRCRWSENRPEIVQIKNFRNKIQKLQNEKKRKDMRDAYLIDGGSSCIRPMAFVTSVHVLPIMALIVIAKTS